MTNTEMLYELGFRDEKYSSVVPDALKAFQIVTIEDFQSMEVLNLVKKILPIDGSDNYRQLVLILAGMLHAHDSYTRNGIGDDIFFDTMSDAIIWTRLYEHLTGEIGLGETSWMLYHINLELFRLGRLQFQLDKTPDEFRDYVKKDEVIQVHIPDDGILDPTSCRKSFLKAREFYKREVTFVCDSWLLEPELSRCLRENSNILSFQKFFHVFRTDKTNPQCHQRVFEYSRRKNTSLQVRIIEEERKGTVFGVGYGFFSSYEL